MPESFWLQPDYFLFVTTCLFFAFGCMGLYISDILDELSSYRFLGYFGFSMAFINAIHFSILSFPSYEHISIAFTLLGYIAACMVLLLFNTADIILKPKKIVGILFFGGLTAGLCLLGYKLLTGLSLTLMLLEIWAVIRIIAGIHLNKKLALANFRMLGAGFIFLTFWQLLSLNQNISQTILVKYLGVAAGILLALAGIKVLNDLHFESDRAREYQKRGEYTGWAISLLIMVLLAGWYLTGLLGDYIVDGLRIDNQIKISSIKNHIANRLNDVDSVAKCMSVSPWIEPALDEPNRDNIERAASVLTRYKTAADAEACFLVRCSGDVLVSSGEVNQGEKSFASQAFFNESMEGGLGRQVSFINNRGYYYISYPVKNADEVIAGSVIIKSSLERFEQELYHYPYAFLLDSDGRILLSGHRQYDFENIREFMRSSETIPETMLVSNTWLSDKKQAKFISVNNESHLFMYQPVNTEGWGIVLMIPTREAVVYRFLGMILTLIAAVLIILGMRSLQKTAEYTALVAASEKRFRSMFENAPEAILIYDINSQKIIEVNPYLTSWLGLKRSELINQPLTAVCDYHDQGFGELVNNRYIPSIATQEGYFINKNKSRIYTETIGTRLIYQHKECMLLFIRDITQRREMEKRISRLNYLRLAGQVATEIAHQIRQPMTTVRGFLQLFLLNKDNSQHIEEFELMIKELDYANNIITRFLELSRHKSIDSSWHNLNTVISKVLPVIQNEAIEKKMELRTELDSIPDIFIDEKDVAQIILNLANNGLEAMEPGGVLTISTQAIGNEVVLTVKDQGSGIETAVMDKIGTPFFTTKDNGIGLGMATCYSIAARYQANIDIETSSEGSSIYVRFNINNMRNVVA